MATINLSFDHLYGAGCQPEEIMAQIQALEAAGLHVNLQVRLPKGMEMLQQLPAVKKQRMPFHPLRLAGLFMLGVIASITVLVLGVPGL